MNRQAQVKWAEVKIGLLVALALAILLVMVMNIEEGVGLLSRQVRFHALVDHTQGLKVGGPVRMSGVDVGNVRSIAIATGTAGVDIVFTMKPEAASHLREDASVSIRPMGLLGDKFLEVLPGTPSKPPLPTGSRLAGKAEGDIGGLASSAGTTMEHVNAALQDIQRILLTLNRGDGTAGRLLQDSTLYDQSKRVMDKLERATDKSIALLEKVERGEGTIGGLMNDKEIYARVNTAVKELNELTSRLNNQNGTLVKLTDPTLYTKLESITTRGEQLLIHVEQGEGTIGKLVTRDELYQRADRLLTEVETFVADVEKHPTKYFQFSVF